MLERHLHRFFWYSLQIIIHSPAAALHVRLHLFNGRPVAGRVLWKLPCIRIYSRLKKIVQARIGRFLPQTLATNLNGIEAVQMSEIKDDAMPLSDGPQIHRLRPKCAKKLVALASGAAEFGEQAVGR